MIARTINISKLRSFFLFGARATGKSTLLQQLFSPEEALTLDLLRPDLLRELQTYPERLEHYALPAIHDGRMVIIDEVQKVPELLDVVHYLIQRNNARFALTGSSARKLRRGAANLLAGRASLYRLFPLLAEELGASFNLEEALAWGTLPELVHLQEKSEKALFLNAYAETYVQEEIIAEQIIRKLPPFRRFLAVAAQMNGKSINASSIARDINSDPSNVRNYFEVLEDTLLGFKLEPFHTSIRKRQKNAPKFYWFDTGVARALTGSLDLPVRLSTSAYGELFEAFLINQIKSKLEYNGSAFQLSYLNTKDGAEIDLIVERAGQPLLCIEIKSGDKVAPEDLRNLIQLSHAINNSQALCLYNGQHPKHVNGVEVLPWRQGLKQLF